MSIKQNGGVFGRNPTFNDVTIEGDLIINGEVFTGLDFQGSWNASTNSPALASSVGTNGEFYIVSVAGATNLNGITNWGIGDWAIFNGTAWQRVEGGADGNFNDLTANSLNVNGTATANDVNITDTTPNLKFTDTDGNNLANITQSGSHLYVDNDSTGNIRFRVDSNTERLTVNSTGIDVTGNMIADGVGIGTSSPTASLSLSNGTNDSNGIKMQASGWGYYARSGINGTSGGQFIQSTNWNANTNAVDSASYGTTAIIHDAPSGSVQFKTATTNTVPVEAMRIDSSGNVGIGTSSPSASAILDVQSTTKGVRFPNMTTTQKNAMADVAGIQVFDTTLGKMCFNTGSAWETITSS